MGNLREKFLHLTSFVATAVVLWCCAGCFLSTQLDIPPDLKPFANKDMSLKLYAFKSFVGSTDYEYYFLEHGQLGYECGVVLKTPSSAASNTYNKAATSILSSRFLEPLQRTKIPLSKLLQAKITKLSQEIPAALLPPPPGTIFSLNSDGIIALDVKLSDQHRTIVTSMAAVAGENQSTETSALPALFKELGAQPTTRCGFKTF